jgi:hypothetical protein
VRRAASRRNCRFEIRDFKGNDFGEFRLTCVKSRVGWLNGVKIVFMLACRLGVGTQSLSRVALGGWLDWAGLASTGLYLGGDEREYEEDIYLHPPYRVLQCYTA